MSKKLINIVVAGATGYVGLDLIYILSKHPKVNLCNLCAQKNIGKKISFFDKRIKKRLPKVSSLNSVNWSNIDLLYMSLPNGEAQKLTSRLFYKYSNLKFIDLSADFRLTNISKYKKWYKTSHKAKNLIKHSLYSISEFVKKDIKKYRIIANPGCYSTSIQLPLMPLLRKKLIKSEEITIDSKSGYSGAGKNLKSKFTHKNLLNSVFAYSVNGHRHSGEIDQEFNKIIKKKVEYTFNPHLLPTFRGILSSIYVLKKGKISTKIITDELKKFYKKDIFISIEKPNTAIGTGQVINTNYCQISVCQSSDKKKFIIFSAIDNLIKGASGQAVQNMNLIYGFNQKLGLK
jgi:N-acetyl-gamma-glutamyl-phosphate reductase|tara:strand:+ start:328 stop:1362 length:1035 start_codon:yes stop_codon:yes gene_type:complete